MRRLACATVALALCGALVPSLSDAAEPAPQSSPPVSNPAALAGGLILTLDGGLTGDLLSAVVQLIGVKVEGQQELGGGAAAVRFALPRTVESIEPLLGMVAALPGVVAVEPDRWVTVDTVPNDKYFPRQYNLWSGTSSSSVRADYSVDAPALWSATTGSKDVVVAVVDSGLTNHPELKGQRVRGYDFVSDPWVSRDGDGWDARPTDPGAWSDGTKCGAHPSAWHGTHVAGIIAARRDNGIGISGIAPGVKVQPVRVVGRCFGLESDVLAGIRWASGVDIPGASVNQTPADVINLSLSAPVSDNACPAAFQSAIDDAVGAGAIVVASAGNQHTSATNRTPANCDGVITVGAVDRFGNPTAYTNAGHLIDFMAPGGVLGDGIWSSVDRGSRGSKGPGYARYAGTSMAAPAVSGAAALMLSLGVDGHEVISVLRRAAQPPPIDGGCFPTVDGDRREICGSGVLRLTDIPVASKRANIVGKTRVGKRLRPKYGQWNGRPTRFSYQWRRDGVWLDSDIGRAHTVTADDLGHRLSVRTTSHTPGYPDFSSRSKSLAVPKARSRAVLQVAKSTVRKKARAVAVISVRAYQGQPSHGKLRVFVDGRRIDYVPIADGQTIRVRLPKMKPVGRHHVRVYFKGNATVAGDWSKRRLVRVVK